jgi:peptidoglycan/xylan/chitin deacetylase (PgdA/CDA1 family)
MPPLLSASAVLPPVHPAARRRAASGHGVTLLVWHDIVPRDKLVWFDTTAAEFNAQLSRLERAGARPISLDALYTYLSRGTPAPPSGAVVLCFDDNTAGISEYAAPRLVRRGWPWVLSAHTAYVGVTTGKRHNSWDTLRRMEQAGATIVSQTHTHPADLRTLGDAALAREMTESRRRMEAELRHPIRYVTYPSGKWDRRVALAARSAGYLLGLTEDRGAAETSPHLLGLHRYSTHRRFDEAVRAIARAAGR